MRADDIELRLAWERALGRSRGATALRERLVERHRQPHRRYHDLRHVGWVVRHVHELAAHEPVDDLDAVVVAAWYHDAVYLGRPGDDERASAELARSELTDLGLDPWPPDRIERVAALVIATAHLTGPAADASAPSRVDHDAAVLVDADLAVLGAPPAAYLDYVRGVRAEYAELDDARWRTGRTAAVRQLLDRSPLFLTPTGRSRWGSRARANLTAELAGLVGAGG